MIKPFRLFTTSVLCLLLASAQVGATPLDDPSIKHQPKDGIVKLYGAGGPDTALRKVADAFEKSHSGTKVEIIAGPESKWSKQAQADADVIWGTSEQSMTAFLETYTSFTSSKVVPIYMRPAVIAVKKGNPKKIQEFDDLLRPGIRIVVTEGAGVYNTSGTGVWEDVAGRLGRLSDVVRFRENIIAFAKGSGASFKAFKEQDADAWITWPNWPLTHPDEADMVEIAGARAIWRDLNVSLSPAADPAAAGFLEFLVSNEGQKLMKTEGWVR